MKKKVVALMLATTMLLGGSLNAFAQEITVTGDTATGSSTTVFSVTADMLGGDLIVTVPDSFALGYVSDSSKFTNTLLVNAKGNINPSKKLEVSVPTEVTYIHTDVSSVDAVGTITFGVTDGDKQKETWTASELRTGGTSGVDKSITSAVPLSEVEYIGTYESEIVYDINLVDAN